MAETVSPKVAQYIQRTEAALTRVKKGVVEAKTDLIEGGSAAAGAFAGAYLRERYPDRKIAGVDPDAVGVVVFGGAAAMSSGMTQTVCKGLAIGMLCSTMANVGAKRGAAARAAAAA